MWEWSASQGRVDELSGSKLKVDENRSRDSTYDAYRVVSSLRNQKVLLKIGKFSVSGGAEWKVGKNQIVMSLVLVKMRICFYSESMKALSSFLFLKIVESEIWGRKH